MAPWQPLLDWWFGPAGTAAQSAAEKHRLWFGKRDEQDAEAKERFGVLVEQALAGELQEWSADPHGWLANVLLLDQLPRMIHRDTPLAFAGDAQARELVEQGITLGWDRQLSPLQRVFIYLVLEHTEEPLQQARSVDLFEQLAKAASAAERELFAGFLDYARRHQRVIQRFGRFPHRNEILGRVSSADELRFLAEPGSRF
ncbi:DUF924 domain-containing protein [Pseudomonas argentinensis]|uniref:Uncharacterized conserved protein, DUF924 family n=1 Tax=Phytopseudomonas argentinensis TaxID=289370 RepID=A0A1I3I3E4_9GAMM|nr:DUF924 family protein [Pseudomonas argentinensis]KAB0547959.1 DUF924 domain-containing protein [Pseudomonas argentinensis]SFI42461.1 Uncharacterized conserved protein, DUF924 family [Pseudomonas argentinensis]